MSLPTNPLNRKEAYLNAIATGNTVDMPAKPITREEAYLDAIAKNGGGSGGAGVESFNGRTGAVTPQAGDYSVAGLSDIDISEPTDGQVLKWDADNKKWKNADESGGGGGGLSVENYQVTLDSDSYSKWGWVYVVDKNGNSVTPEDGIFLRAWGEGSNTVLTMDFVVLAEFGNRWMGRVRKVGNIADVTGFYGTMNFSFLRIS